MNNDVPNNKDDIYFEYLDDLRDSGATNMYAAVPYLMDAYDLPKQEAINVLVRWVKTYDDRHYGCY